MQTSKKALVPASLEQSFALYEIQHALTDGIFEPTRKTKDARLRLREVIRETRLTGINEKTGQRVEESVTLTFLAPSVLNPLAESILLAIVKLAGTNRLRIDPDQPTLPLFNTAKDGARKKVRVQTSCTKYQLLKESGMSVGKTNYKQLTFYLEQLALVTIKWENHSSGWHGMCHLMEYVADDNGSLMIQLNWRLASVILGIAGYDYAMIDLNERHTLKKDPSKTLHRWLSAHLWAGKREYITYEKLVSHIWTQEASGSTQRMRFNRLKHEVLPELDSLANWTIKQLTDGAYITHHETERKPEAK